MSDVLKWEGEGLKILDFDLECRPLSYLGQDYTTAEITAIAAGWAGKPRTIECWCLGTQCYHGKCRKYHNGTSIEEILVNFRKMYDEADMVTGHYILGFDMGVINGAMLENGMPPLDNKYAHDTKVHLKRRKYQSVSQENLGAMLGLEAPKIKMNTPMWRLANRLTPEGIDLTYKRCAGDVRQHMQLRTKLLDRDWLNPPTLWTASVHDGKSPGYTP